MIGVRSYPPSQWETSRCQAGCESVQYFCSTVYNIIYIYVFPVVSRYSVCICIYIYVDSLTVSSFILYHIPMISHYHSRCSRLIFPLHITQYVFCVSSHPYSSWNSMFPCFQRYFSRGFNMFLLFPPPKIPYLVGGLEHGFYFSIYWE